MLRRIALLSTIGMLALAAAMLVLPRNLRAESVTFTEDATIACYDYDYEGYNVFVNGAVLTVQCAHTFNSLTVTNGGVVTHPVGDTLGLNITTFFNISVDATSRIDANGRGYAAGTGPGAAANGVGGRGGGAYGGDGGDGGTGAGGTGYGSLIEPLQLGSGGGGNTTNYGAGAGGGLIRLIAAGTLTVDGQITAGGGNAGYNTHSGGGSGGSIYINVNGAWDGTGSISANGGSDGGGSSNQGAGGGGGRIAIYYGANAFTGTLAACGGANVANSGEHGGAGTVYLKANSAALGELRVGNCSRAGEVTTLADIPDLASFTATTNAVVEYNDATAVIGSLVLSSAASLWPVGTNTLTLNVADDATIENGAYLTASGRGYAPNSGPGGGTSGAGGRGGGAYGGHGGDGGSGDGGVGYGSITQPVDLGSGGGNNTTNLDAGAGGGALRLIVGDVLTVDGQLTANGLDAGYNAYSGGGAGGSLWLSMAALAGTGTISAYGGSDGGGSSNPGAGGGGGRIAIYYLNSNTFAGTLAACGGANLGSTGEHGGAGTVYTKALAQASGTLRVDNCGNSGEITDLSSAPDLDEVLLSRRCISEYSGIATFGTVQLSQYATLRPVGTSTLLVQVSGNMTIDSGSTVHANSRGYGANGGPGAGTPGAGGRGGGAYGGDGGNGSTAGGGAGYGSMTEPTDLGSGGGDNTTNYGAGAGGGVIRLIVGGTFTVNGILSSAGGNGISNGYSGGGAGGSLWLTVGSVTGNGAITANGGSDGGGSSNGAGGGGGGRIAIYYDSHTFAGTLTACGGGSSAAGGGGGAGTIYLKAAAWPRGSLRVSNCGLNGDITNLSSAPDLGFVELTQNSVTEYSGSATFDSVRLSAAATLQPVGTSPLAVNVLDDLAIESGCTIHANSRGFGPNSGPGAGTYGSGGRGGGAYGGNGGDGDDAGGGTAYGSITEPVDLGSGGGQNNSYPAAGTGGGAIRLIVGDALNVEGTLSATGGNGGYNSHSGGGSGGSLWLTVGTLSGAGVIRANGGSDGAGPSNAGGGGGGGRIAIDYTGYTFSGTLTACGGTSTSTGEAGGAGTIYFKNTTRPLGSLLVSNCGTNGEITPLGTAPDLNLLQLTAAAIGEYNGTATFDSVWLSQAATLQPVGTSPLVVQVTEDMIIDGGCAVHADARGFGPNSGPGGGTLGTGGRAGGSYGGLGGAGDDAAARMSYGSITEPVDLGSGGGNNNAYPYAGTGGGVIRLSVGDDLVVNGLLSANGTNGGNNSHSGGGSGGSLWLTVSSLSGSGTIRANGGSDGGGSSNSGGGGGGGRIALYYDDDLFTGSFTACGGTNQSTGQAGGAGTIYRRDSGDADGVLLVNNCGTSGAETDITNAPPTLGYCYSSGVSQLRYNGDTCFDSLRIGSGTTLRPVDRNHIVLNVSNRLHVESGASINASGRGYGANEGPGAGTYGTGGRGGGGYGGAGGNGTSGAGGAAYGTAGLPVYLGSGGGNNNAYPTGGAGGGAMRLNVRGILTVDGQLLANGLNGGYNSHSGGGSGGSIYITAPVINGAGVIRANGGSDGGGTSNQGGGGGGGRIAIYTCESLISVDSISVAGGTGANGSGQNGQPGTTFYSPSEFTDCNSNGLHDACELAQGLGNDCNGNWIPDECEELVVPVLTVRYTGGTLLLRWTCVPGFANYRVFGKHGSEAEVLLTTTTEREYDATALLGQGASLDRWVFRVVAVD